MGNRHSPIRASPTRKLGAWLIFRCSPKLTPGAGQRLFPGYGNDVKVRSKLRFLTQNLPNIPRPVKHTDNLNAIAPGDVENQVVLKALYRKSA